MSTGGPQAEVDLDALAGVVASTPIATAVVEIPSTRFLVVNDHLTDLLGFDAGELTRMRPVDITYADDRMIRAWTTESPRNMLQKRYVTKHGDIVHARVHFRLLRPERDGQPGLGLVHFIDISTEVIARDLAGQHEQLLHVLFKEAIVPMSLTIKQTQPFLDVNEAFCRLLGYSLEELLAMSPADLGPTGEAERLTPRLAEAVAAGQSRMTLDRRFETKDGRILDTVMNVAWTDTRPRTYAWQLIDVTELNLERRARAQSEAVLDTAFGSAPVGIAVMTAGGRFGLVNEPLAVMLGADATRLIGELVTDHDGGPLGTALEAGHRVVTNSPREIHRDSVVLDRGSGPLHVEVTICPVPSADDEVHHVVALVVDTTDSRNLVARLDDIARSKDAFIASASRELRTPLSVILGLASELRTRLDSLDGHEREKLVEILSDHAEEMADLVENLLTGGRGGNSDLKLTSEVVSVPELVDRLAATVRDDAASITVDIDDRTLVADPVRLRQILRNLMRNAVRHGGPSIWIRTEPVGEAFFELVVEDDGPGPPPGVWEEMVSPVHWPSIDEAADLEGRLGLLATRRLAAAMGGTIEYSRGDGRTRFTLRLPRHGQT